MILSASKPAFSAALLFGAVLSLGVGPSAASPGPMQVEEPDAQAGRPPIQPNQDGEGWKSRKNATLSESQQAALKARQDTMKDMMALIQQKRRAIREAPPQHRQALAQELHRMILDQAEGAERGRGRAEDRKEAPPAETGNARTQGEDLEVNERALEKQEDLLRKQESRRQQVEEKLKQAEAKAAAEERKAGD